MDKSPQRRETIRYNTVPSPGKKERLRIRIHLFIAIVFMFGTITEIYLSTLPLLKRFVRDPLSE